MRDVLLRLVLSLLFAALRLMSRKMIDLLGAFLAALAFRIAKKDVRRIGINIAHIYGLPRHSSFSRNFSRQVITHQIRSALEVFKCSFATQSITVSGMEEFAFCLKEHQGKGRGVIIVTGHMGSWELVGRACAQIGGSFHALAKPSKLPSVTKALQSMRSRFNIGVLWTENRMLLRRAMRVLRDGGTLGFVMDQKPDARIGPIVNFMGQPTQFVNGPASIAAQSEAPVQGVFCMREGPWQYRIFAKPISAGGEAVTDQFELTQKMASVIEEVVRLYPEQWAWNYRRWNFPAER